MTRNMLGDVLRMLCAIVAFLGWSYFGTSAPRWIDLAVLLTIGGVFTQAAESLYRKRQAWRLSLGEKWSRERCGNEVDRPA